MRLFDTLNDEGITVVLVTHEIDVARHARRRIVLRDGTVVEDVVQSPSRLSAAAAAQAPT
jgi:putative ABC transport system ATP-binding protein